MQPAIAAAGLAARKTSPRPARAAPITPSGFVDDAERAACCGRREARRRALAARQHRAPADAVAARHPAGAPAPRPRAATSRARRRISTTPSATTIVEPGAGACSTDPRFARAVRAGQPRRGSDRRPRRRAAPCPASGRPAGGHAGRGADRRLQDQPPGAAQPRRGAESPSRLCAAARALPRRADAALSRTGRSAPLWCGRTCPP